MARGPNPPTPSPEQTRRATVVEILYRYIEDKSRIVKTFAMQALADFAERDRALRLRVLPLLDDLTRTGSPAMRSRGRRLVARLLDLDE